MTENDGWDAYEDEKRAGWYEKAASDFDIDMSHQYLEEEIARAFEERSIDAARAYLGTYGDAITARVRSAIDEARALLAAGHPGPALALAATAVELTVRDLIVRSTVQGAFLSGQWAAILADQIVRDAPGEPRRLLPLMAEAWDLDLDKILLPDGTAAWGVFTGPVMRARNAFVHRAEPVPEALATRAIGVAVAVLEGLVGALAMSVGMNWPANPWHMDRSVGGIVVKLYEPHNPYQKVGGTVRGA